MTELELGQATIVYDHPEEGQADLTVDNEQIVYARDHWMVVTGTDEEGNDLMKQIPRDRVHHVERNVERFEEEARTVRHRVESIARDLRQKLPIDVGERAGRGRGGGSSTGGEPVTVEVEEGEEPGR